MNTRPKLHTFFEDESGGYSMTRLLRLLWVIPFVSLISFLTVVKIDFPPIPVEYVWLTGIFVGGGVASKFIEKKPVSEALKEIIEDAPK